MLYEDGRALNAQERWERMTKQLEEFHAICNNKEVAVGASPLTQKYFNRLYFLMAQEKARKDAA